MFLHLCLKLLHFSKVVHLLRTHCSRTGRHFVMKAGKDPTHLNFLEQHSHGLARTRGCSLFCSPNDRDLLKVAEPSLNGLCASESDSKHEFQEQKHIWVREFVTQTFRTWAVLVLLLQRWSGVECRLPHHSTMCWSPNCSWFATGRFHPTFNTWTNSNTHKLCIKAQRMGPTSLTPFVSTFLLAGSVDLSHAWSWPHIAGFLVVIGPDKNLLFYDS